MDSGEKYQMAGRKEDTKTNKQTNKHRNFGDI